MKNEDMEKTRVIDGTRLPDAEEHEIPSADDGENEDVSIYYPDGDSARMAEDDAEDSPVQSEREQIKARVRKKNSRLTKSQITLIAVIFVLYTVVIVTASWILFYKPAQPKPSELPFDITPIGEDSGEVPGQGDAASGNAADPSEGTAERTPEGEVADSDAGPGSVETEPIFMETGKLEDQPKNPSEEPAKTVQVDEWIPTEGMYNILIIGMDKQANLADVTMIVNVNTANGSITVMQIPRDTLITTGVLTNKINAQYSSLVGNAYHAGDRNSYYTALDNMARILEKSLCIKIHKSVMVSVEGLVDIVDACGGVDVYVPGRMLYSDPEQDLYIDIQPGWQHLDGYNAMGFVRFREDYVQADLGRLDAQKIFLSALYKKVVELVKSFDVPTLAAVAGRIQSDVVTDMSISDIQFFVRAFLNIGMERVNMFTIPGNLEGSGWYYVVNRAGTLNMINQYFNIYQNKTIENSFFDRNCLFCFTNLQYICDVYYAPATYVYSPVYDAATVDQNSIYIPFN